MDPQKVQYLHERKDDYGDDMLEKLDSKWHRVSETAMSFGFDVDKSVALMTLRDLTRPCFGEIGEAFIKGVDPSYTRKNFVSLCTAVLLSGFEEAEDIEEVRLLCEGVANITEGKSRSAEEEIVCIVQEVYDHADVIEDRGVRSLYRMRCIQIVQDEVNCPYPKGTFFLKRKGACVKAQVLIL